MGLFHFILKPEDQITIEDLQDTIIGNIRLYKNNPGYEYLLNIAYNYMRDLRKKVGIQDTIEDPTHMKAALDEVGEVAFRLDCFTMEEAHDRQRIFDLVNSFKRPGEKLAGVPYGQQHT